VVLPVPGLPLLGAEGLLHHLGLAEQQLGVLGQVVDPHGAVGRDAQRALLVDRGAVGRVVVQREVVHGQEESGGGGGGQKVREAAVTSQVTWTGHMDGSHGRVTWTGHLMHDVIGRLLWLASGDVNGDPESDSLMLVHFTS